MDWVEVILESLKQYDVRVISYVPDTIVWRVLERAQGDPFFEVVRATREDEAIGVASGAYMGGARAAVFMQSSGFGNCPNVLGSLNAAMRIPVPMIINMRGEFGEYNYAQVPLGRAVRSILDAMGFQHFTLSRQDETEKIVEGALKLCFASELPLGILLSSLLTGGKRV